MIWNEYYETISREQLRELQSRRFNQLVRRLYDNVPYYRDIFQEKGLEPGDIKGIEDLDKLPFTSKKDIRENYPYGLFGVPLKQINRIHASSGTTGKPTIVGYTENDLAMWSEVMARIVSQAGVTAKDTVQVCMGYGLFTGGLGLHYGLEKVGAMVIPASVGNTWRQIMLMQDLNTTVLVATPSYALYLAEVIEENGAGLNKLDLRVGLFGAEPWTEEMREQIKSRLNILPTDNYGLSELIGPGVSGECTELEGLHIAEDHFFPEIIDPETGEVLDYGQEGELVFTTLTKEGFPVLRYRTGDISMLYEQPCGCGRTTVRMKKVTGRTDDMIVVRGINVFPSQVETVLMGVKGVAPHYQIVVDRKGHLDEMEVIIELEEDLQLGGLNLEELQKEIKKSLYSVLSINVKVNLVEPKTLARSEGKATRVIDKRIENAIG